jgi:hypothetical protein
VGPAPQPRARQPRHPGQTLSFKIGAPVKDDITRAVVVRERHVEGEGLVRLVLADPRGRPLPAWSAGSHVDLVAGGFRRKYSLCGTRDDRSVLEVVILREAQGAAAPGISATPWPWATRSTWPARRTCSASTSRHRATC